jgi:hypothetical protein
MRSWQAELPSTAAGSAGSFYDARGFGSRRKINLPESGNGIPDLVNEALWCMDLFLRIQQEDGGPRWTATT